MSDTALYAEGIPTLCIGLRGLVYTEVKPAGPMRDLHSGLYGGSAPNAVYGLIELLAKAKSPDRRLQIPGIYDEVKDRRPRNWKAGRHCRSTSASFSPKKWDRRQLTGEPGRTGPGACLVAAHTRGPRDRGRIHGRGRQNSHSCKGDGESELPSGSRPGP